MVTTFSNETLRSFFFIKNGLKQMFSNDYWVLCQQIDWDPAKKTGDYCISETILAHTFLP